MTVNDRPEFRSFALLAVLVLGVILACSGDVFAQERFDESDVLDKACPRDFKGIYDDEALSLRFLPFERPEIQINIRFREKQGPEIIVCQAVGRSILLQLEDLRTANPKISLAETMAQLKFERYPMTVPKKFGDAVLSELSAVLRETQIWSDRMRKKKRPAVMVLHIDPMWLSYSTTVSTPRTVNFQRYIGASYGDRRRCPTKRIRLS